jgi:hypothetical protein
MRGHLQPGLNENKQYIQQSKGLPPGSYHVGYLVPAQLGSRHEAVVAAEVVMSRSWERNWRAQILGSPTFACRVLGGPCVPFPELLRAPTWIPKMPPKLSVPPSNNKFMESYHIVYKFICWIRYYRSLFI